MLDTYRQLKVGAENLVSSYPSANIVVDLVSGKVDIAGLSYDQIAERESKLQSLSSAEKDLFVAASILYELLENDDEKVFSLTAISSALYKAGRTDQGKNAFLQLYKLIKSDDNKNIKKNMLGKIIEYFNNADQQDQALDLVGLLENERHRAIYLAETSKSYAKLGETDKAIELAGSIDSKIEFNILKAEALIASANALAIAGKADQAQRIALQALELAKKYDDGNPSLFLGPESIKYKQSVATVLFLAQKDDQAFALIIELEKDWKKHCAKTNVDQNMGLASTMAEIAVSLAESGRIPLSEVFISLADEFGANIHEGDSKEYLKGSRSVNIATALSAAGKFDQALAMLKKIRPEKYYTKIFVLEDIVVSLVRAGNVEQALEVVAGDEFDRDRDRARILMKIARVSIETGRTDLAQRLLPQVLELAKKQPNNNNDRDKGFSYVAEAFAGAGSPEQALEAVELIRNKAIAIQAIVNIASTCERESLQLGKESTYRLSQIVQNYYPLEAYQ